MNILFATSEAIPYIKSGGLADVAGSLAKSFAKNKSVDCRVILPYYEDISEDLKKDIKFVTSFNVPLGWRNQYCGLLKGKADGVTYYFLENEYYFKRKGIYGFFDDAERFAFFSKAVLEVIAYIDDFIPDVIHCNDWQTAMIPVYLNVFYRNVRRYEKIKTVFTIHNIQYQGTFHLGTAIDVCGLPADSVKVVEYNGDTNFMKGAIEEADVITTVSPTYAKEILDPWYSHSLDPLLATKKYKLHGIINGIDYDEYSPAKDPFIKKSFSKNSPAGKAVCKKELQKELGLEVDDKTMIVSMVTRLTGHKGLDIVQISFDRMMNNNIQFVVLGSGDWQYESFFSSMVDKYPGRVALKTGFNEGLAHRIYSGSDSFLMPSKSEPCGLSQMIALSYGTIPIVRKTGGLSDTIVDLGEKSKDSNGYTFLSYFFEDLLSSFGRAYINFQDKKLWKSHMLKAFNSDFSWDNSAKKYVVLYKSL